MSGQPAANIYAYWASVLLVIVGLYSIQTTVVEANVTGHQQGSLHLPDNAVKCPSDAHGHAVRSISSATSPCSSVRSRARSRKRTLNGEDTRRMLYEAQSFLDHFERSISVMTDSSVVWASAFSGVGGAAKNLSPDGWELADEQAPSVSN